MQIFSEDSKEMNVRLETGQPVDLKTIINSLPENALKWTSQMFVAIMEKNPLEVLRIGGNHQFLGADNDMAFELVSMAVKMLINAGYLEEDSEEGKEENENSLEPSLRLTEEVSGRLKQFYDTHDGALSEEAAHRLAQENGISIFRVVGYFSHRKHCLRLGSQ